MLHRALLILICDAVEFASVVEESLGAVARGTGAHGDTGSPDILAIEAPITLTCYAIKLASLVEESLGAVGRDTGAHPGHHAPFAGILEILAT